MSWIIKISLQGAKKDRYWGTVGTVIARKEAFEYSSESDAKLASMQISQKSNIPIDRFSVIPKEKNANKYGSKPVCVFPDSDVLYEYSAGNKPAEAEWFGSKLEANTFLLLRKYFDRKNIHLQYPVLIKPKTSFYPKLEWKVDFCVREPFTLIEAKGIALPEFKRNVQYFQYFNQQQFSCLTVVGDTREKIDSAITKITLDEFERYLARIVHAYRRK
ncbi:MAG: hypothetical protein ACRC80_08590 [Waterburya sp.]